MELLAVIVGLEALKKEGQHVVVYSDSKYVVDAVEKGWLRAWIQKNFKGKKNADLWKRFWKVYQRHQVKLRWIKGHAGHPENERCDQLAVQRARQKIQAVDQGYIDSTSLREPHCSSTGLSIVILMVLIRVSSIETIVKVKVPTSTVSSRSGMRSVTEIIRPPNVS